jgi:hypothetical protein
MWNREENMVEIATLVLSIAGVAIALYAVVIERIVEHRERGQEWQKQYYALKEEIRRNLDCIAALERENLNGGAVQKIAIRQLIKQLSADQCAVAGFDFFQTLQKRRARRADAAVSAIDPYQTFSVVQETAKKIASVKDRAERAEENAPNAQRTLLAPRIRAIHSRLDAIAVALSG